VELLSSYLREDSSHKTFCDCLNNCVDVIDQCGGTLVDYNDVEKELSAYSSLSKQQLRSKLHRQSRVQKRSFLECFNSCVLAKPCLETAGRHWKFLPNWCWPVPKICEQCLSMCHQLEQWPKACHEYYWNNKWLATICTSHWG